MQLNQESNDAMIWLRAKMFKQNEKLRESPVKINIMGANEWREYPIWPPNKMQLTSWYLQSKNGFSIDIPAVSEPDS